MLDDIKEFFQAFLAPQLEGIKGDIRALDSKFDAKLSALDTKVGALDSKSESFRRELLSEIHRVESTVDLRLASMDQKIDLIRRELLAEIRAAAK